MYDELKAAGAAATSLKTALDMTKAFLDVKGAVEVQGKVFELQRVILAAQQDTFTAQEAQAALLARVRDLEKQIADLQTWDREKERYELAELTTGVLAYRLKPQPEKTEPDHWLCPNCFDSHKRSVLQKEQWSHGRLQVMVCNSCGAQLIIHGQRQDEPGQRPQSKRR